MVDEFLNKFESAAIKHQRFHALKWALWATLAQWWGTHQVRFENWCGYRRMMRLRFRKLELQITVKYDECGDPCTHLTN